MHSLGIVQIQEGLRWALICCQDKKIVIERLEESSSIPPEVLSIKNLSIVTGLEGETVLRRDLTLPLSSKRLVRLSLPFQLEAILPFPLDQSIVFPEYQVKDKETVVTLWATTQEFLQSHLTKWQSLGIDPDQVSFETLALARWARFFFPKHPQFKLISENLGLALDHGQVVCAMHSLDSKRLQLFLDQKYPLFENIHEVPAQDPWSSKQLWHFAIPIGLALEPLEKKPCQLRCKLFKSFQQKKRETHLLKSVLTAGLTVLALTFGIAQTIFYFQKQALKKQTLSYTPLLDGSLESNISQIRQKILQETRSLPPIPNLPTVQEILSWLSTLQTSVDIQHVKYQLTDYPQEKLTPYQAQVTLEFQADSSSEADEFVKQLQQSPSFVESTYELKWTLHPSGYEISFPLRKIG